MSLAKKCFVLKTGTIIMGALTVDALSDMGNITSDPPTRYFLDWKIKEIINKFYCGDYIHQKHTLEGAREEFEAHKIRAILKVVETGELEEYEYDMEEVYLV